MREFAELTTKPVTSSLDCAQISQSAFDWLCKLSASYKKSGAKILQVEDGQSLKWDNYVGVIETPCGTRIEVLPKHVEGNDCNLKSRKLLQKMIQAALHIAPRKAGVTVLKSFDAPLSEWIMQQFLSELQQLFKRGMRFDYQRLEEERYFLRGQLNVIAQMRQPAGKQHHFQIRHDVFMPNRPENRLLKKALDQICKTTRTNENWRLAHEVKNCLQEIEASTNINQDFAMWRNDRLMAHYQPIKPWCELILKNAMPLAIDGNWQGMSLLFPMEKLFENYVGAWLSQSLQETATLKLQSSSEYICKHSGDKMFQLCPDFFIEYAGQKWILDTKWKRIEADNRAKNYGIEQSDIYQLFAYGHKYLEGKGNLALIYPKWSQFEQSLPCFDFGNDLILHVLPFDLDAEMLVNTHVTKLPLNAMQSSINYSQPKGLP